MKKFQAVLLALFAVSALGAVFAMSASAEITLLAEWLVDGAKIVAGESPTTEATGSISLKDTGSPGEASVLCTATIDGTVSENGADLAIEVLNAANLPTGTPLTGLALVGNGTLNECVTEKTCAAGTATEPIEVWPENLPWPTLLFLMEDGKILNLVEKAGYELLCWVLLLATTDLCEAADTEFEVLNDPEEASIPTGEEGLPLATCELGGAGTGVNKADGLTEIKLVNGKLLTVSSE